MGCVWWVWVYSLDDGGDRLTENPGDAVPLRALAPWRPGPSFSSPAAFSAHRRLFIEGSTPLPPLPWGCVRSGLPFRWGGVSGALPRVFASTASDSSVLRA